MPVIEKKGDLFRGGDDIIVHGCNCFNKMGKGVAGKISKIYPGAAYADNETQKGDKKKLGTYTDWSGKNHYLQQGVHVINAYTQYRYGTDGALYLSYDALRTVMTQIKNDFAPPFSIGMPQIGAGLAGGDWNKIKLILEEVFDDRTITVWTI